MVDAGIPKLHLCNSYRIVTTVHAHIFATNTRAPLLSKTVKDGVISTEVN